MEAKKIPFSKEDLDRMIDEKIKGVASPPMEKRREVLMKVLQQPSAGG